MQCHGRESGRCCFKSSQRTTARCHLSWPIESMHNLCTLRLLITALGGTMSSTPTAAKRTPCHRSPRQASRCRAVGGCGQLQHPTNLSGQQYLQHLVVVRARSGSSYSMSPASSFVLSSGDARGTVARPMTMPSSLRFDAWLVR